MTTLTVRDQLAGMGACSEAVEWAASYPTLQAAWDVCKRSDWMLWLLWMLDGEPCSPRLRLAACACARTALHLVAKGEDRPRIAIETAERYARGEATDEELRAAAYAAAYRVQADLIRKIVPRLENEK